MKRTIHTDSVADPVAAYSLGTTNGPLVFTAGQVPLTPDGEDLSDRPITEQTRQVMDNVERVLEEGGCSMDDVLKATVFLTDIDDFEEMNDAYAEYFDEDPPARSAVAVDRLYGEFDVEIEVVADAG